MDDQPVFFAQALFWLDQTYPDWKTKLTADFSKIKTETLCIPDCLDFGSGKFRRPTIPTADGFDEILVKSKKAQLVGEKGEELFFAAFRKLKLGGILVHGLYSGKFIQIMIHAGVFGFNKSMNQEWEKDKRHFECDFIFIHQQLGFVIIETKGFEKEDHMSGCLENAFNQLNGTKREQRTGQIAGLRNLHGQMFPESSCCFPFVRGIVCMSSFDVAMFSSDKKLELEREYSDTLIDRSHLLDAKKFRQFWENLPIHEFEFTPVLTRFIAVLIAHRPAVLTTATNNAMEIYRRIDKHDFGEWEKTPPEIIIPNEAQISVIESDAKHLIISGSPGTGKTLCLLERVLRAAKKDGPGRIVVAMSLAATSPLDALSLAAKFEKIFASFDGDDIKRKPIITFLYDIQRGTPGEDQAIRQKAAAKFGYNELQYSPVDDLFCDEIGFNTMAKRQKAKLAKRSLQNGPGYTTLVFTGHWTPSKIADTLSLRKRFNKYEQIELKTVIRGTKNIIAEWEPLCSIEDFPIGHNITGSIVERYSVSDVHELNEKVGSIINTLLTQSPTIEATIERNNRDGNQYQPEHCTPGNIAVLTVSSGLDFYPKIIEAHLKTIRIKCGNIIEQVRDSSLIAVDQTASALSYDWPFVVVVSIKDNEWNDNLAIYDSMRIIAASRAIAKLIIIEGTFDKTPKDDDNSTNDESDDFKDPDPELYVYDNFRSSMCIIIFIILLITGTLSVLSHWLLNA